MGKRGPAKTPSVINELRGNPGKRPVNGQEPDFPEGLFACPDWLGEIGRAKWVDVLAKVMPVRGLMKPAFADALALYCEAFEEFVLAREEIARNGMIAVSEKGGEYQHPAVGIKNKAIQRMKQFGALFGLSPSDAASLRLGGGSTEEFDPLVEMLKRRNQN